MRLPVQWLFDPDRGLLEGPPLSTEALCEIFTFGAFPVDGVERIDGDDVIVLDVTANRPDCQCVLGLARELTALVRGGLPALLDLRLPKPWDPEACRLRIPPTEIREAGTGRVGDMASVELKDPAVCPRYTARVILDVKVGPSPEWLCRKLRAFGLIPRNNVVDATNYVMFELNHPLHAFDLDRLAGRKIVVRRARNGEAFAPLYGQCPPLTDETLVIADAERPVAIGGVIGGAGCEVSEQTSRILLEAAYFDPPSIRRTSRRLGIGTESSFRFERGIDAEFVDRASARAALLIREITGGRIAEGTIDCFPHPPGPVTVSLRYERCRSVLGLDEKALPAPEIRKCLEAVGCSAASVAGDVIAVRVPSWRRRDVSEESHLIEECARLHGYNAVPDRLSMKAAVPRRSRWETDGAIVREVLTALGYSEAWSDSLTDPSWPSVAAFTDAPPHAIRNPLRSDHAALRNSLLPSLLAVRRANQDARATGRKPARMFEIGRVYLPRPPGWTEHDPPLYEPWILGILDDRSPAHVLAAATAVLEAMGTTQVGCAKDPFTPPGCAPGKGRALVAAELREPVGGAGWADARWRERNGAVGYFGQVDPAWIARMGLKAPCSICEVNLSRLADDRLPRASRQFAPLPRFPEVIRDVAMVVDEGVAWGDVIEFFRTEAAEPLIQGAPSFLSAYRGKQAGPGKKSLAFSLVYRSSEGTLTDEQANAAHQKVVERLLAKFKAALRM